MKNCRSFVIWLLLGTFIYWTVSLIWVPAVAEFVICNPKSTVNVHGAPGKGTDVIAYAECGDELILDGETQGDWVHIVNGWANHDGWIHKGYVSDSPVIVEEYDAVGYLKVRIRNYIGGKVTGTLAKGQPVTVYACAIGLDGWAVTNRGYIMAKYLDDGMGGF